MADKYLLPYTSATEIPFEEIPAETPVSPYGPKRGYQSWAQTIRRVSMLPADELRKVYGDAIAHLERFGNITLRELVIVKVFEELVQHPNPAMLNLIMERDEGRVPQQVVSASGNIADWVEYAKEQNIPLDEVMEEAAKILDEYNKPPDVVDGEVVD